MDGTRGAGGASRTELERKAAASPSQLQGAWQPSTVNVEARTVEVVFSTGEDVTRQDFLSGERFVERLRVDADSVDLGRLNAGAPVVDSHNLFSVHDQLGRVLDAWIENGNAHARLLFSEREAADAVFRDIAAGVLTNISVGYRPIATRELDEQIDGIPVRETYRWEPIEISIVSVPADSGAQVRAADQFSLFREGQTMTETRSTPSLVPAQTPTPEDERRRYILDACTRAKLPKLGRSLIDEAVTIEESQTRILDTLIAADGHQEIDSRITPGDGVREADFVQVAAASLLHRSAIERTEDPAALQLANGSLFELARQCASLDGVSMLGSGRGQIAQRAVSTATLPAVVALVAERSAGLGYEAEPRRFVPISREVTAANFQQIQRVKLSDASPVDVVLEGADYTEGTLSDSLETYALTKFGKLLVLTWELILADDTSSLTRAPQMMGASAAKQESDSWWGILSTNGLMADGNPIFNATDGNTVVGTVTAADFEEARRHLSIQQTENGVTLDLEPAFVAVHPDERVATEKLLAPPRSYTESTLASALTSSMQDALTLVVDPRVGSGNILFFAANNRIDTMEHAYLSGFRGPRVTRTKSVEESINDSVTLKVTLPFGAQAIDRRGMYRITAI